MGIAVLEAVRRFLHLIESDSEMDVMRVELRQAIEGGLRRCDIESIAAQVLAEQGREDLSPGRFSDRYLSDWNNILRLKSERSDLLLDLRKLIERTLSEVPPPVPFTGKQIIESLGISEGPLVGELVRERDRLFQAGTKDPQELLTRLRDYVGKRQQPTEPRIQ